MQVLGNFSYFFEETALPALRMMVKKEYDDNPPLYTELFNVMGSEKSIEQFAGVTGFGLLREIGQGEDVQYDQGMQTFPKTFKHKRFGLGFKTDRTLIEDDNWGLISFFSSELGRSVAHTREIMAASVFNNAFTAGTYAGPDGQALCSTAHPIIKTGAMITNLGTSAQLSVTSLQLALIDFGLQRDDSGKLIRCEVDKLLVHPWNQFTANEIVKSDMRPDTNNNATNALKYAAAGLPKPFVWNFLTSQYPWFLLAKPKKTGLVWFDRKNPYTTGTVDHDSEAAKTAMRFRNSYGFRHWRGVYGNQGV